jgi:hypothetical protein
MCCDARGIVMMVPIYTDLEKLEVEIEAAAGSGGGVIVIASSSYRAAPTTDDADDEMPTTNQEEEEEAQAGAPRYGCRLQH